MSEIERLIEAITEEIYLRIGGTAQAAPDGPSGGPPEACACGDCDGGACPPTCAGKARVIVEAGACRVSVAPPVPARMAGEASLASLIDHTLLKPEATRGDVSGLCQEARQFGFASVCVNPAWVALAAERLRGSAVRVCTVAGFPLGATTTPAKRAEAAECVKLGAHEVDMVLNVGALRWGDFDTVRLDIAAVAEAVHAGGALLKVILETALLDDEQKVAGCLLAQAAGADFVKTSTGFGPGGATAYDVELMRFAVGGRLGVKAAGGVRSLEDLKKMVAAGATRIGASASVKIMHEASGPQKPDRAAAGAPVY